MPYELILMPYKENCKTEGEILTKIKIIRMHLFGKISQKEIAKKWQCNKNTIGNIMKLYKQAEPEAKSYLVSSKHIPTEKLILFDFLK